MHHIIVGGGPAGLAAARAYRNVGLEPLVLEAHNDIGGIWDQSNPGSPMYDSAHFISSSALSGFAGFPMPADYPDYPSHQLVLKYLRGFADAYGLRQDVRLGERVERATPTEDGWLVRLTSGEQLEGRSLLVASGTNWHPRLPDWASSFTGEVLHSSRYRSPALFDDRRVLVVGAGNSGVDIACDAAGAATFAALSMRRGYRLVPKHVFGIPADQFASRGPHLPMPIAQRVLGGIIRLTQGDPTRLGWPKPDHRLFESHPICNDQVLHHLRHGDLHVRPDIAAVDGTTITFADGRREDFDVVLLATGYDFAIPYLDPALFDWRGGRPQLYLQMFHQRLPRFAALGLAELDNGAYPVFDEVADVIARAFHAVDEDPVTAARLTAIVGGRPPDVSGGVRHVDSPRHDAYLQRDALLRELDALRSRVGWPAADFPPPPPGDAGAAVRLATAAAA